MSDDLFTFFGGKDKNKARTLSERIGDTSSFRTAIEKTAKGTVMLRTKGGMPRVTTTVEPVEIAPPERGEGWWETDFTLRTYGDMTLTTLSDEMGGFFAVVRPITSIDMIDKINDIPFLLKPFDKVETT